MSGPHDPPFSRPVTYQAKSKFWKCVQLLSLFTIIFGSVTLYLYWDYPPETAKEMALKYAPLVCGALAYFVFKKWGTKRRH